MQPWRKAALEQIDLRMLLIAKINKYFRYRKSKKTGEEFKAPCTLEDLHRDQVAINKLRREASLPLINYIASMHTALKHGSWEIEF